MELDFLEIETPASAPARTEVAKAATAAVDLAKVRLTDVALAQFGKWRDKAAETRKTLTGVVHDFSTQSKVDEGKSLRQRLINAPLAEHRKTSKEVKSELNTVSGDVGAELKLIEAEYEAIGKLITPQIEAAQEKIDEQKRIEAEKETARKAAHQAGLDKLADYAEMAKGLPSERIAKGIELVEAIVIDRDAWEEFADRAEEQKSVTLERMRALLVSAQAAEAEAARLEAERAEAARVRAEQEAEAARLAKLAAELERERAELAAAKKAEEDRKAAEQRAAEEKAAQAKAQAEATAPNTPEQAPQQVLKAEASEPDATDRGAPAIASPSVGSMGAGQPSDEGPAGEPEALPATVKLGEINALLLPLTISADGLVQLGIKRQQRPGSAAHFLASDLPAIKAALIAHLEQANFSTEVTA